MDAEFGERKGAIFCWPAPLVNLVVDLQGHADACQTFYFFQRSLL